MTRGRRSFTTECKADAVAFVQQQGYTVDQACQALGIGETALRRWVMQVKAETAGLTPRGRAITSEQQRIQALEAQVKRLEMEKAIFKKAATLLAEDVSLAMR
ncbi:MAG: transposase [Nitrospirae bacterium]|nr:transposase [Nitrospirota bacterium]MDA1305374.1 transposase [Nitrospirota bacterium]